MDGAIYVGRPTIWGNPFKVGPDGTRAEVIERYRIYFYAEAQDHLRLMARQLLTGKDLICWCWPLDCHARIILEYVNGETDRGSRAA